jgi:protein-S-isoprenylcysteine O-methyltransferase Ste14
MLLARALLAFLLLPGLFAGILPWLIAAQDPWRGEGQFAGWIVLAVGACVLIVCVRDFLVIGRGSLAPWDPPRKLVIVGLYRYVRNPMYVGVLLTIAGSAIAEASPAVWAYLIVIAIAFHLRVIFYEERHLRELFGADWDEYARRIRRWWPNV